MMASSSEWKVSSSSRTGILARATTLTTAFGYAISPSVAPVVCTTFTSFVDATSSFFALTNSRHGALAYSRGRLLRSESSHAANAGNRMRATPKRCARGAEADEAIRRLLRGDAVPLGRCPGKGSIKMAISD